LCRPVQIGAAVLVGTAWGVFTLLHTTAISDHRGSAHYGRMSGLLVLTAALAPWIASTEAGPHKAR
jgi:hypothetical protein